MKNKEKPLTIQEQRDLYISWHGNDVGFCPEYTVDELGNKYKVFHGCEDKTGCIIFSYLFDFDDIRIILLADGNIELTRWGKVDIDPEKQLQDDFEYLDLTEFEEKLKNNLFWIDGNGYMWEDLKKGIAR